MLNKEELTLMFESMLQISQQSSGNNRASESTELNVDTLVRELLDSQDATKESQQKSDIKEEEKQSLTLEEFLVWTVGNSLPQEFSNLIFQVSHYILLYYH